MSFWVNGCCEILTCNLFTPRIWIQNFYGLNRIRIIHERESHYRGLPLKHMTPWWLHYISIVYWKEKIHLTRYVDVLDTIPIQHVVFQQSARPHRPILLLWHWSALSELTAAHVHSVNWLSTAWQSSNKLDNREGWVSSRGSTMMITIYDMGNSSSGKRMQLIYIKTHRGISHLTLR